MKNLFELSTVHNVKGRLTHLTPDSQRLWGKMNVAQAVAHCSMAFELAAGERRPPRAFLGRIIGRWIKPMVLRGDEPMRRNSPTVKGLIIEDQRNLDAERELLYQKIDHFAAAGPNGCTTHPHSFFGQLTPEEWAVLMYKHLDHHLRQFGA